MAPIDVRASRPVWLVGDEYESLDTVLGPGDVLFIRGENRLLEIGVTGGSFGHVLLVTGQPRLIEAGSDEGYKLQVIFPMGAKCIWSVPIAESTSSQEGLHQAEILLVVDAQRRVLVLGEQPDPEELISVDPEVVELWLCPEGLRSQMREDLMCGVIAEMKVHEANWSFCTAAKAWLAHTMASAEIKRKSHEDDVTLWQEVQECWLRAPICTSVVIIFWQRYLCSLAGSVLAGQRPLDLVMKWMPVKADRGLPDDLLKVMRGIGWRCLTTVPRITYPSPFTPVLLNSMSRVCSIRQNKLEKPAAKKIMTSL